MQELIGSMGITVRSQNPKHGKLRFRVHFSQHFHKRNRAAFALVAGFLVIIFLRHAFEQFAHEFGRTGSVRRYTDSGAQREEAINQSPVTVVGERYLFLVPYRPPEHCTRRRNIYRSEASRVEIKDLSFTTGTS